MQVELGQSAHCLKCLNSNFLQRKEGFSGVLTNALNQVNQLSGTAQGQIGNMLHGGGADISSVMIAVEKADVAFQLMDAGQKQDRECLSRCRKDAVLKRRPCACACSPRATLKTLDIYGG